MRFGRDDAAWKDGASVTDKANQLDRGTVLEFFATNAQRPWHEQDIARKLKLDDRTELRALLNELTENGALIRTRRRTYGLPEEMNLLVGRLQVTAGGNGFVILDEGGDDLFVPADQLGGAWDGDRVVARPSSDKSDGNRQAAEIVRVLERKHTRVVGTLEYSQGYAILRPDSSRLGHRILLTPDSVGQLPAGSRLVASLTWPEDSGEKEPFGMVEEYLGEGDDPEIETRAVIIKFGLHQEFEEEVLDRKSTRLNSSHVAISYAVFCWKKKKTLCKATYKKTVSTTFSSKVSFNLYYIIEFIERIACISCTIDPVNDPHSHIYT